MHRFRRIQSEFDAVTAASNGVTPFSGAALPMRAQGSNPESMNGESSRTASKRAKVRPGNREILIAVMGATRSGKSHFCRAATGVDDVARRGDPESRNAANTLLKYIC